LNEFIKGLDLCESFFNECALPLLQKHYPDLRHSAGLIGWGSDVLGYDDAVSTDHQWGPRFYLFLRDYYEREIKVLFVDKIASAVKEKLKGTGMESYPLIGSFSGVANLTALWDSQHEMQKAKTIYQ